MSHQASIVTPDNSRLIEFVHWAMEKFGLTEQEVKKRAIEEHGSLECAMQAIETAEAENRAAVEKAISENAILLGRKPYPGEEVKFSQLRDDLIIRVWGGDLGPYNLYSFDFVDGKHQYIRTPEDVKIYAVPTPFSPSAEVLSIQQCLENTDGSYFDEDTRDPNWETYLIHEGMILRITQENHPDRFLHIPTRIPNDAILVLQPWVW